MVKGGEGKIEHVQWKHLVIFFLRSWIEKSNGVLTMVFATLIQNFDTNGVWIQCKMMGAKAIVFELSRH